MYFFTSHLSNQGKYWSFYTYYSIIAIGFKDIQVNVILLLMHFF